MTEDDTINERENVLHVCQNCGASSFMRGINDPCHDCGLKKLEPM